MNFVRKLTTLPIALPTLTKGNDAFKGWSLNGELV